MPRRVDWTENVFTYEPPPGNALAEPEAMPVSAPVESNALTDGGPVNGAAVPVAPVAPSVAPDMPDMANIEWDMPEQARSFQLRSKALGNWPPSALPESEPYSQPEADLPPSVAIPAPAPTTAMPDKYTALYPQFALADSFAQGASSPDEALRWQAYKDRLRKSFDESVTQALDVARTAEQPRTEAWEQTRTESPTFMPGAGYVPGTAYEASKKPETWGGIAETAGETAYDMALELTMYPALKRATDRFLAGDVGWEAVVTSAADIGLSLPTGPDDIWLAAAKGGKALLSQADNVVGAPVFGIMAGQKAKGWAGAEGKFSSLYDKKPRFEIDDSGAMFRPFQQEENWSGNTKFNILRSKGTLEEVLNHPALFDAVPESRNWKVDVTISPKHIGGSVGNATIGKDGTPFLTVFAKTQKEARETLIHEITHPVQDAMGFARGGSPQSQLQLMVNKKKFADELLMAADMQERVGGTFSEKQLNGPFGDIAIHAWDDKSGKWLTSEQLRGRAQKLQKQIEEMDPTGTREYVRLAGEIEARDAAARADLTAAERAKTPPYSSENIAPEDAIVRFGGGEAAMAKPAAQEMAGLKAGDVGAQRITTEETVLGPSSYGVSIYRDGKFTAEGTFSVDAEGNAKIGMIRSMGGAGTIPLSEWKQIQSNLKEKYPSIKTFSGDRVTRSKPKPLSPGDITTPEFKEWSGGAPVIQDATKHEFKTGEPVVAKLYHGGEQPAYPSDYNAARNQIAAMAGIEKPPTMAERGFTWEKAKEYDSAIKDYIESHRSELPEELVYRAENLYRDIESFDLQFAGKNTGAGDAGYGFFFTPDMDFAKRFTYNIEQQVVGGRVIGEKTIGKTRPRIYEVYARLSAPVNLHRMSKEQSIEYVKSGIFSKSADADEIRKMSMSVDGSKELQKWLSSRRESLIAAGYDSIVNAVRWDGKIRREIMVLHPEQIKSTQNKGSWSKTDPRILQEEPVPYRTMKERRQTWAAKKRTAGGTK